MAKANTNAIKEAAEIKAAPSKKNTEKKQPHQTGKQSGILINQPGKQTW